MRLREYPPRNSRKGHHARALDQSALLELVEALKAADGASLMRSASETMLQALLEAEATAHIGAAPHERSEARTTQRNGHRPRLVTTTAGDVTLRIPKTRTGSCCPALLAPRRRIDVALHAVIQQAYVRVPRRDLLQGASWQRSRVHFMRNALARVSEGHAEMVAATIRTFFAQPTADATRAPVDVVADMLAPPVPRGCSSSPAGKLGQGRLEVQGDLARDVPEP